jgi:hypothetical protein
LARQGTWSHESSPETFGWKQVVRIFSWRTATAWLPSGSVASTVTVLPTSAKAGARMK